PKNLFVAGFIGSPKMNFLTASAEGATLKVAGGSLALDRPVAGATTLGVRPEHITLAEGSGTKPADVCVDLVENLGGHTVVYATTSDDQPINIVLEGQNPIALGATVSAHIDPARLHLFNAAGDAL
ncbi:MAG: TOBE domain-containing protein, partial [Candidatus Devosia euplotis]|nr:TOBE domain-containing protein [Candidatus Devosia euplotis]